MLPLRDLNDMEDLWGLRSAGALMNLPSTGVSVLRWTRKTAGPFQFDIETSQDFMMFSMVLLPMDACSRVDDTVIWDGPIEGGSVRLIDSRTIERTGFESPSPFDLLHIHFSLGELRATARRFGIDFEDFEPRDGPLYRDDHVGRLLGAQLVAALVRMARPGACMPTASRNRWWRTCCAATGAWSMPRRRRRTKACRRPSTTWSAIRTSR